MAFSGTLTTEGSDSLNYAATTKDVGNSITPDADDIVFLFISSNNTGTTLTSATADYGTFVKLAEKDGASSVHGRLEIWACRADGSGPDKISIVRVAGGYFMGFDVVRCAGGVKSDGTTASIEQQEESVAPGADPATPMAMYSTALSSFQTDSLLLSQHRCNKTMTGFASVSPMTYLGGTYSEILYSNTEDTTPECTWTTDGTYGRHLAISLEILADGGGGPAAYPYHSVKQRRRAMKTLLTM